MSTITKERVKDILEFGAGRIISPITDDEIMELARIALASLEAEIHSYTFEDDPRPLYTATPATVSVMDEAQSRELFEKNCMANIERNKWHPDLYAHLPAREQWAAWEACRAAMLQGVEPVTTAYKLRDAVEIIRNSGIEIDAEKILAERDALNAPDCWCRACRPITLTDMRFVVCPDCGNKRCPHANDHRNACSGSNEPGQEGSAYPAAPQQEA